MKAFSIFLIGITLLAKSNAIDVQCNFMKAVFAGESALTCFANAIRESIGCDEPDEIQIVNECDLPANTTVDDVEGIYSKDIEWPRFPINLHKKFPRLKAIQMENGGIENLRSTYLFNLTFLVHFSMPRNKFRSLQGRLFRFTPKLRSVNFNNNPSLKNIGFNIFGNLPYLKNVNFTGAGCGSEEDLSSADSGLFSRLASRLMVACPPDEEDLASDLESMDCTFNPDKESKSKSKETNGD